MRWWLSFADDSKPKGSQSLGCCIVHALDGIEAIKVTWIKKINPGGEVRCMQIEESNASRLSFSLEPYENRLLDPEEAKTLADRIEKELGS